MKKILKIPNLLSSNGTLNLIKLFLVGKKSQNFNFKVKNRTSLNG